MVDTKTDSAAGPTVERYDWCRHGIVKRHKGDLVRYKDHRAAVAAQKERDAELRGVAFGDWLLDWFGQNPPQQYDDEGVGYRGGYSYAQIADLSKMLERRFAAAIREGSEDAD